MKNREGMVEMPKQMTEDEVRSFATKVIGLEKENDLNIGTGQITTFNQLGFKGVIDKPDGWFLPKNSVDTAFILETKATKIRLGINQREELKKNISIVHRKYKNVVGVLYNGIDTVVFKNDEEYQGDGSKKLQTLKYYTSLFDLESIDKEHIYEITAKINNSLHFNFGIKNLYHRMIFTACALVAKRYSALMVKGMDYSEFHNAIINCLNKELIRDKKQNQKLSILTDVFSEIKMNLNVDAEDEKEQQRVIELISDFIDWVEDISDAINSDKWNGEDVMGIFFNEFNRYKSKSESGQIFTPEHITDFMYKILEVNPNDYVLDAAAGSGGFLAKSMANMIQEAGGVNTKKAQEIKQNHLYGIEFDREIFALACANMLIHKDGKTNLEQLDSRTEYASQWISDKNITKILMNPPYEKKYGCIRIVENVLDSVKSGTMGAFIMPDKKLEKTSKKKIESILSRHRLRKIVKLPEDLFFNVSVTTSIFVFEAGIPQNDKEIFTCYMKSDGLITVKNKGRHDVYDKWNDIEQYWLDVIEKQSGDESCSWINPKDYLSYQKVSQQLQLSDEDFRKTVTEYVLYKENVDLDEFVRKLSLRTLYGSVIGSDSQLLTISVKKENNKC